MVPGIIDPHVHIAGAGGEGGPVTRTPEMPLRDLLEGGVTTVIGCLGTDGITRDVRSVLMKVKALREEGVSSWMYTGSYQVPPPSVTGDYAKDVALIDEVIGVGEIALSDHRSSTPSTAELIKLTEHTRVAGMLAGKAGIVNIHMGDAKNPFQPLYDAVNSSELPLTQFYPTHCNRNENIFKDAKEFGKKGYVDMTSSSYPFFPDEEVKPSKGIKELLEAGVPIEHITISSDANGSLPQFDEKGNLVKLERGKPEANLKEIADAVNQDKLPLETAIKTVTSSVADILKLKRKGYIQTGFDADCILLDEDFKIKELISNGTLMVDNYKIIQRSAFE
jgi:beta-aspartyl-dipeptidase (metallo-type)